MPIIQEAAKATAKATTKVRRYPTNESTVIRKPNRPVTPFAVAYTFMMEATAPPQAPPIMPAMKGRPKRIFTPKMAGSVMPMKAEREAGSAIAFVFLLVVLKATAIAAAPCATFAAVAMGIHVFMPLLASIIISIALYIW